MAESPLVSSEQTKNTIKGAVVGGLATAAVVAAAPIVAPALGLAALGAGAVALAGAAPWLGAAVGGLWGYNKEPNK